MTTVANKLKKQFSSGWNGEQPLGSDPYLHDKRPLVRKFCAVHAKRGDSDFEDCDDNYEPT